MKDFARKYKDWNGGVSERKEMVAVNIRIEKELHQELFAIAKARSKTEEKEVTVTSMIRDMIQDIVMSSRK